MNMSTKPEDKPKKSRAAQLVAASAALTLAKLEDTIARAKQTLSESEAKRKAILDGLEPEAKMFLDRLRGTAKS
jgi:hypothetical protein